MGGAWSAGVGYLVSLRLRRSLLAAVLVGTLLLAFGLIGLLAFGP
jgi:hypothetical protein